MTPDAMMARELLEQLDDDGVLLLAPGAECASWLFDELDDMWQHARGQALRAYDAWRRNPGADAYATFRSAQDRADAAQDAVAQWSRLALSR